MAPPGNSPRFWLQNPVATRFHITSHFNDPRNYSNSPDKIQRHEGTDFHALDAGGRPVAVLAAQRGVVDKVDNYPMGYGKYVRIRHDWPGGDTYVTWYGHLSKIKVRQGQFVLAGQELGTAGDTGFSFGVHLHLTLQHLGHGLKNYVVDDVVDPEPFFRAGGPPPVDECMFVADETVPDGTALLPGQSFTKTWRVRNSGTKAWTEGYRLVFFEGDQMGAPQSIDLPPTAPGNEVSLSVPFTAPTGPGRYRSVWKPSAGPGSLFDFEIYTEIVVAGRVERDDGIFLEDLTIPDGMEMAQGQTFLKKWRVRNTGNSAWRGGYRLAHVEDERMGAPAAVPLPATRAGEEAEICLSLTAPEQPGLRRSTWRFQAPDGQFFGEFLYAVVEVARAEGAGGVDELSYVDDVTIEDGTLVQPGQALEKVWRVRNSGTTTWDAGYALVFVEDEQLGGPDNLPLPAIGPGQVADISLTLTAPQEPGVHRSTWKPRTPAGEIFEYDLFTEIEVVRSTQQFEQIDDAKFVRDVTVPDGTVVPAGGAFLKTWRLRNTGTTTWGEGYSLEFVKDEQLGETKRVPLPLARPGEEVEVSVAMQAPLVDGSHKATWRPHSPDGEPFGHWFFAVIRVPSPLPVGGTKDRVQFVAHESFPPGTVVKPGQRFTKRWRVRNIGENRLGNGYSLSFFRVDRMGAPESVAIPKIEPGRSARLEVTLTAPTEPGRHRGLWKLRDPRGKRFGPRFLVSIRVKE